jgi:uncharacterized damage-inducible protein DinB
MNMLDHFRQLFAYDHWANHEVLHSLQRAQNPPQRAVERLAHILSAERLWLERLRQQQQTQPVWPQFALDQCTAEIAGLAALWKDYLAALVEAGLTETLAYKNTKGETFTSQKQDILLHVIMHSAYHRGQIASDMRAAGFTPAYTDFIHAVRQGFVKQ